MSSQQLREAACMSAMSHKPKNFILLIEIVERELPASVLVGAELAARGHNVWLIEKGRFRKSPASFPPSLVLEKGLSRGCLPRFRSIRGAGHALAVMCQEGFIYRSGEDYIKRRVDAETVKNVDYLFLWGERQKKDLESFLGSVRGYRVTGSPRLDLLHRRFRDSWDAETEEIHSKHGDFVLFTSRFSAVNHFRRSLDQTLERRKGQYTAGTEETVGERLEIRQRLFVDYMNTIEEIGSRLSRLKFVVRPHPIENIEVWRARFHGMGNVEICNEGVAAPWLSAARCVVHNACTTGIEAYLLDKPVIEYHPASIPRGEFDPILPGQVTGTCDSTESLAKWIEANASAEVRIKRNASAEELIEYHLQNYREPNAYREMADALESFRGPRPWAKALNMLSKKHDPRKMQQRYFSVREVERLLRSYMDCECREKFAPPVLDEVGIRLVSKETRRAASLVGSSRQQLFDR
jgi:surface carbohydrate biosynthesis protein